MKVIKILLDRRVATAIISAASAIVCAVCTGCKFGVGKVLVENLNAEIYPFETNTVNNVME